MVACGNEHMAAVNAKGQVLTWGHGTDGQLGHDYEPSTQHPTFPDISIPRVVAGLENIVSVACGKSHTIALTREGSIYGWGATVAGQAGFENQGRKIFTPRKLPDLRCKIVSIAAGELHSIAVAENGMVYSWGWGSHGRLGHGDEKAIYRPTLLHLHDEVVLHAACGSGHTILATKDGKIFSWGAGIMGQLGHGRWNNRFTPSRVKFLEGIAIKQIACGSWHSAAISDIGELYTWGCGEAGQLGNGLEDTRDESNQCLPRLLPSSISHLPWKI